VFGRCAVFEAVAEGDGVGVEYVTSMMEVGFLFESVAWVVGDSEGPEAAC